MSLTIYDHEKKCQVLNPEHFTPVVNAFHPDYVKTYMPEFLSSLKVESMYKQKGEALSKSVSKTRSEGRTTYIDTQGIALAPKEFHTFSKAGMPKKGKKK